jgi:hypothetical protein
MLIVKDILGVGRLWIIIFYVSDVLLEAGLQVPAGLTHIRKVAGFTGQTVDPHLCCGVGCCGWGLVW